MQRFSILLSTIAFIFVFGSLNPSKGQIVPVGSGSYTTVFPGVDPAGRNTYPSGTPYTSGIAADKPVPTNDWWSAKVKEAHVNNLFNYPTALRTMNDGLVLSYIEAPSGPNGSSQPMDTFLPIIVGVDGLNAASSTVADFSDWTLTINWANASHSFNATVGLAMPFYYFTKNAADVATITVNEGSVTVSGEMIVIENAHQGADFAIYAPMGSTWSQSGNTYTSTLNGKNYWSAAYLAPSGSSVAAVANEYKKYAYVFPVNTSTSWDYDEVASVMRTEFLVETEIKEGSETNVLLGLLPHQWGNLAADSPTPDGYSYSSIRGEIQTLDGNEFFVENTFHGILPTLPYLNNYSQGFDPSKLNEKISLIENDGLATWTDSYNEGQVMNRLIQTARIADLTGDVEARDKMVLTIKDRLEDWLIAEPGEVAFIFYYNSTWSALIGYPAGHGQDGNLNDHHFHWGYFIHAAAFVEQFDPGWADDWGEMINHLVRDAATTNREDELFPYLRNFSPYAGHSWANGFATFPFGNDQESSSESMQFSSALIHWGAITGNSEIRELGIYLYTTEHSALQEYWFDENERTFKPEYEFSLVSRIWGNGYDNQTFWTSDIAAAYGIELYPIHGGSLYLGHNQEYVQKLWTEMTENTGILNNQANDNLWHDVYWQYQAFLDPEGAIELYDSYPDRSLKFGVSEAQTYYWLHAMNAIGYPDASLTADYPVSAAFNLDGEITYVAHNYTNSPIVVSFSDGYQLDVPATSMATSRDISISGSLSSSFTQAFPNGSVDLTVTVEGGTATKVEFLDGSDLIGEVMQAPYVFKAENLVPGKHAFYARVFEGEAFAVTNTVTVVVGRQLPYLGSAFAIPGTIEAGLYDKFEGGNGQDISYVDVSVENEGGFRPEEYVDALLVNNEGATVGWVAAGEWLEYSVNVDPPGYYSFSFRNASDNTSGGGPFYLELDGNAITDDISAGYTGGWDNWVSSSAGEVALSQGEHILRVNFQSGEFNLGEMTFTYVAPLDYNQPVADAGENALVILPASSTILDGSGSFDPGSENLSFNWTQVYGPSVVTFSDNAVPNPEISSLEEGVYLIELEVENESGYSDTDDLFVTVSTTSVIPPVVNIVFPEDNAEFIEGEQFTILAEASDLDGTVEKVEFFEDDVLIGTTTEAPYALDWSFTTLGSYEMTAKATDNDGNTSISPVKTLFCVEAPPCNGTHPNGEWSYEFSPDVSNPTLTFIPSIPGVGSPTCLLYYSTSGNQPFPGYGVTPNVPYQLVAEEGSTVYFYYTYSYPGQGEHTTVDAILDFEVGNCIVTNIPEATTNTFVEYSPNPVSDFLNLKLTGNQNLVQVYNSKGSLIDSFEVQTGQHHYNMASYQKGIYFFRVSNNKSVQSFKVVKD
jgi:endoglucanase Acf2